MKSIVILFAFIGSVVLEPNKGFFGIATFDQCEGKDPANYSLITQLIIGSDCAFESVRTQSDTVYLLESRQNGQKVVNELKILVLSIYPAGAYYQYEVLHLGISGTLEGKFVYSKEIGLFAAYFKKCSSVLGYSYLTTKTKVLLIADKLDPNIFLNPTGAFEPFKKYANTICQGRNIYF